MVQCVGKPLRIDAPTMNMSHPSLAHFCVELDLTKERLRSIKIGIPNEEHDQEFTYESLPEYCLKCRKIGHHESKCRQGKLPASKAQLENQVADSRFSNWPCKLDRKKDSQKTTVDVDSLPNTVAHQNGHQKDVAVNGILSRILTDIDVDPIANEIRDDELLQVVETTVGISESGDFNAIDLSTQVVNSCHVEPLIGPALEEEFDAASNVGTSVTEEYGRGGVLSIELPAIHQTSRDRTMARDDMAIEHHVSENIAVRTAFSDGELSDEEDPGVFQIVQSRKKKNKKISDELNMTRRSSRLAGVPPHNVSQ